MSNLELKGLKLLRALDHSLQERESTAIGPMINLDIGLLKPGKYQPRRRFDETTLEELANSIRVQGVIQPLIVRQIQDELYEIIAGERRWRAAKKVGLTSVPAIVRSIDDNTALVFSLIENIQRQNLNLVEEAMAFNRFHDEFGMTHEEIAQMLGRSRTSVTNTIRLLSLESSVREMLIEGKIEMGHARSILTLSAAQQYQVACLVIEQQLNVRETEALSNQFKASMPMIKTKSYGMEKKHHQCHEWSRWFSERLKMDVVVKLDSEGKGKVMIEIDSVDDIKRLKEINKWY